MAKSSHPNTYHERAQPHSRSRSHPLLEKHKDYRLRARDHATKQKRLKALRAQADNRNPDEFSFGMISASRPGVKKRSVGNTAGVGEGEDVLERRVRDEVELGRGLRTETVKLLKTQDAGFLRTVRGKVRRELERLKGIVVDDERWGVLGAEDRGGERKLFADDVDGQQKVVEGESEEGRELEDGDKRTSPQEQQRRKKKRTKLLTKLSALQTQNEELSKAERELDLQRARMQGNFGGVNKNGVKFKIKERKR